MFFKKKLKCSELANFLIKEITKEICDNWGVIENMLVDASNKSNETQIDNIYENHSVFMILAVLYLELNVAENLCGEDVYLSLRKHIVNSLAKSLGREEVDNIFTLHQMQFNDAAELGDNPLYGLSSSVYDALRLPFIASDDEEGYPSPMVLLAITTLLTSYIGTTKSVRSDYKLICD